MGLFGTKKPVQPSAAQPDPKGKTQTPLGMLKSKASAGSTVGILRDRKSRLDQAIADAGG